MSHKNKEVIKTLWKNPEYRKMMSDAHRGKKLSEETKHKMSLAHKGKKMSEATKEKLRKPKRGNTNLSKGKTHEQIYGKEQSIILRKNLSDKKKGIPSNIISPIKDKTYDEFYGVEKSNIIKKLISRPGPLSAMWRGGISFEPYNLDWTNSLKHSIRKRDNFLCQLCSKHKNRKLAVHHIDYDKKNCNPDNLISLCVNCHGKTNINRRKWTKFFISLMKIRCL